MLTHEEMEKLNPKHREAVAIMEMRLADGRRQLLRQVQETRGFIYVPLAFGVTFFLLLIFRPDEHALLIGSFILLFAFAQIHAAHTQRRLNALVELLEPDLRRAAEGEVRTSALHPAQLHENGP